MAINLPERPYLVLTTVIFNEADSLVVRFLLMNRDFCVSFV